MNATNPGQFYYNAFVEPVGVETFDMTITVPWPFVTQGAKPVHVYDADATEVVSNGCFGIMGEALERYGDTWTMEDYCGGSSDAGSGWSLVCDEVTLPDGSGNCELTLQGVPIPDSGQVYVNVHLDFGLKGPKIDANPCDAVTDRYDYGSGPWECAGYHARENTYTDDGPRALTNLRDFEFSHEYGVEVGGDTVQNINLFKKISGSFGVVKGLNDVPLEGAMINLVRKDTGKIVRTTWTDQDGFYTHANKHKGKPTIYTVELYVGSYDFPLLQQDLELRSNGWADVNFFLDTMTSTVEYGKGKK
jgi:hypothetical protein